MKIKALIFTFGLLFLACGGGGGGGSSSDSNLGGDQGIRIMHAALDIEPVALKLVDGQVVTEAEYIQSLRYFSVPSGSQTLRLFKRTNQLQPITSSSVNIDGNGKYSFLLFGDDSTVGLSGKVFEDGYASEIPSGAVAIRVIHAAVGAAAISYEVNSASQGSVAFGGGSNYFIANLAENSSINFNSYRSVDQRSIVSQSVVLESGKAYTLLVTGEVGLYTVLRVYQD